jgi:hypothetical protein
VSCNRYKAGYPHDSTGAKEPKSPIACHNRRRNVGRARPKRQSEDEFAHTLRVVLDDRTNDANNPAAKDQPDGYLIGLPLHCLAHRSSRGFTLDQIRAERICA